MDPPAGQSIDRNFQAGDDGQDQAVNEWSALISSAAQIDYSSLSLVYLLSEWINMINKRSWVNHPIEGASELG
ncbi:hypothetical protein LINPERPRIM_LOCUS42752 [Linum perenne]